MDCIARLKKVKEVKLVAAATTVRRSVTPTGTESRLASFTAASPNQSSSSHQMAETRCKTPQQMQGVYEESFYPKSFGFI